MKKQCPWSKGVENRLEEWNTEQEMSWKQGEEAPLLRRFAGMAGMRFSDCLKRKKG